jgi:hypothetical protein
MQKVHTTEKSAASAATIVANRFTIIKEAFKVKNTMP